MSLIKLADKVEKVYLDLARKSPDGGVTASMLLNASREEDTLLHDQFEWNDEIAGEKFRLHQARQLLGHITVNVEHSEGRVRAFQSIRIEHKKGELGSNQHRYYPIQIVMKSKNLKARALKQAARDLKFTVDRYKQYKEIYAMVSLEEVEKIERQVEQELATA